eukprot:1181791-Prorocentrum_minimum.AAC.2
MCRGAALQELGAVRRVGVERRARFNVAGGCALNIEVVHDEIHLLVDVVQAVVQVVVEEQPLEHRGDTIARLVHRQNHANGGGRHAPDDGDVHPHAEVALGEHARGDGEKRPDDNHDDGEEAAPHGNPPLRVVRHHLLLLLHLVVGQHVVNEGDGRGELAEVVVLRVYQRPHDVDKAGEQDGHQVADQHGVVHAEGGQVHLALQHLGGDDPRDDSAHLRHEGPHDGALGVRLGPGEDEGHGDDGRADKDAHHEVHKAEVELDLVQDDGQDAHEGAEEDNGAAGHAEDVLARRGGVDVLAVNVVRHQGGGGNLPSPSG